MQFQFYRLPHPRLPAVMEDCYSLDGSVMEDKLSRCTFPNNFLIVLFLRAYKSPKGHSCVLHEARPGFLNLLLYSILIDCYVR